MPVVSASQFVSETFDFLIVGGGDAGLVVAERLTEDPHMRVGVIDQGKHYTYQRVHSVNVAGCGRPSTEDCDAWKKLGNAGWDLNSLLAYFKKSESVSKPAAELLAQIGATSVAGSAAHARGTSGPLKKAYPKRLSQSTQSFIESMVTLGVHKNLLPTSDSQVGITVALHATEGEASRRSSLAKRANLVLLPHASVASVIFDEALDQGKLRARGIEFVDPETNTRLSVYATREIILSAGALGTPKILELSGIGKPDILQQAGIKIKVDLPVGDNLQDHVLVASDYELLPGTDVEDEMPFAPAAVQDVGSDDTTFTPSSYAFVPLQVAATADDLKTITSLLGAGDKPNFPGQAKQYDIQVARCPAHAIFEIAQLSGYSPTTKSPRLTMLACLLHPFSRGSIHITSSDPTAHPTVDLGLLSNPADLHILSHALKFANKAASTAPLAQLLAHPVEPESLEATRVHVKEHARPMNEAIGTAAMLPREDGGVVDSQLNVYGTSNLRVVDASIIPLHISHHLHDTVHAVAEMASDIIKARYAYVLRGVYKASGN